MRSTSQLYLQVNDVNVLCRVTARMLRQQLVNVTQRIQHGELHYHCARYYARAGQAGQG